jgi:hypothetical protein
MRLPPQNPPVQRELLPSQARLGNAGVEAAKTVCDALPGLAQQLCYAGIYNVQV